MKIDKDAAMALSYGALNLADYLTTRRILNTGGEELNPVADFLMRKKCFGVFKTVATLAGMAAIYNDEKDLLFVIDDFRTWIYKMYDEKFTNKQIAMAMSVRGSYNLRVTISEMKRTFMIVSSHEFDIDLPDKEMVFGEVEE